MPSKFDKQLEQLLMGDELSEDDQTTADVVDDMLPVTFEDKPTGLSIDHNVDLEEDYKFVRSNLYGLIGRSNASLELALKIAQLSEHPRALEVAANLMKTSADMSKELLLLQKSISGTNKDDKPKTGTYTQVNNYYADPQSKESLEGIIDDLPEED